MPIVLLIHKSAMCVMTNHDVGRDYCKSILICHFQLANLWPDLRIEMTFRQSNFKVPLLMFEDGLCHVFSAPVPCGRASD